MVLSDILTAFSLECALALPFCAVSLGDSSCDYPTSSIYHERICSFHLMVVNPTLSEPSSNPLSPQIPHSVTFCNPTERECVCIRV